MALTARDLTKDPASVTDLGFDLLMDPITSLSADAGVTKIMLGDAGLNGGLLDFGQDVAAASIPVVMSSDWTLPAGTNNIGDVDIISIAAGTNVIGKFGIDQTTPGTTNAVVEASAAAIKTAVELIDNAISGAGFNITQLGGAAVPIGAGFEATAIRVTLPTDGTGVVNLGAVDNAVLDTIDAVLDLINAKLVTGTIIGAVEQSGSWSVTVSGTALTTLQSIDTNTLSIASNTSTLVDVVKMDDDVFTIASSRGAVVMGVATSDVIDAGDAGAIRIDTSRNQYVVIAGNIPDTSAGDLAAINAALAGTLTVTGGGGGTEYTEDAPSAADPVGTALILKRADTPATIGVDDDNVAQRGTAYGAAYTQIVDSSGNFIDSFGGTGGTSSADDADFIAGTTLGTIVQGIYESSPTSITDGDVGAIGITVTREAKTSDATAAGILTTIDADTGSMLTALQLIDNAVSGAGFNVTQLGGVSVSLGTGVRDTGTQRVTIATDDLVPVTGTLTGVTTVSTVTNLSQLGGAAVPIGAGLEATAIRVTLPTDGTGVVKLGAGTAEFGKLAAGSAVIGAVTQSGTWNVGTVTTLTTCSTVTTLTGSSIAHAATDSGNPHKIGAKATASLLGNTPVTAAQRTNLMAGLDGALLIREGSLADAISEAKTNTDGASTAMVSAFAATASQRIYVTDISISNSSATFCTVDLRDGIAGVVLFTLPAPATGGVVHRFKTPLRLTANTALAFDASAAITTLTISASGFKSKS